MKAMSKSNEIQLSIIELPQFVYQSAYDFATMNSYQWSLRFDDQPLLTPVFPQQGQFEMRTIGLSPDPLS